MKNLKNLKHLKRLITCCTLLFSAQSHAQTDIRFGTPATDFYLDGGKPNLLMTGGGIVSVSAAGDLSWSNRLIILGGGRGAGTLAQFGYFDINMPPVGTVINGICGGVNTTVTATGINLNTPTGWAVVWYKLPADGTNPTVQNNFFISTYTASCVIPPDYIMIAATNNDAFPRGVKIGTGQMFSFGQTSTSLAFGNNLSRTETRNDAGLQGSAGAQSGTFETSAPAPSANWYTGASSYQHLLDMRHSNLNNNYAMQIAGSFFDQDFYGRKTNNNPAQPWRRFVMERADSCTSTGLLAGGVIQQGCSSYIDQNGAFAASVTLPTGTRIGEMFTLSHNATTNVTVSGSNLTRTGGLIVDSALKGFIAIWLGTKWQIMASI